LAAEREELKCEPMHSCRCRNVMPGGLPRILCDIVRQTMCTEKLQIHATGLECLPSSMHAFTSSCHQRLSLDSVPPCHLTSQRASNCTIRFVLFLYKTRCPQFRQRIGSPRLSCTSPSQSPHVYDTAREWMSMAEESTVCDVCGA